MNYAERIAAAEALLDGIEAKRAHQQQRHGEPLTAEEQAPANAILARLPRTSDGEVDLSEATDSELDELMRLREKIDGVAG